MHLRRGEVCVRYRPDIRRQLPLQRLQASLGRRDGAVHGRAERHFTLLSGNPKPFHYIANSGDGLDRNFCPECGPRVFTSNLGGFPGTVFVQLGTLDHPEMIAPRLETFDVRRLPWTRPLDLPQFDAMPS